LRGAGEQDGPQGSFLLRQRLLEVAVQNGFQLAEAAQHGGGDHSRQRTVARLQRRALELLHHRAVEGVPLGQHGHQQPHGGLARRQAQRRRRDDNGWVLRIGARCARWLMG
jgi:hypothetical protein